MVFSHICEDRHIIMNTYYNLRHNGIKVWYDPELSSSDDEEYITSNCKVIVIFLSKAFLTDSFAVNRTISWKERCSNKSLSVFAIRTDPLLPVQSLWKSLFGEVKGFQEVSLDENNLPDEISPEGDPRGYVSADEHIEYARIEIAIKAIAKNSNLGQLALVDLAVSTAPELSGRFSGKGIANGAVNGNTTLSSIRVVGDKFNTTISETAPFTNSFTNSGATEVSIETSSQVLNYFETEAEETGVIPFTLVNARANKLIAIHKREVQKSMMMGKQDVKQTKTSVKLAYTPANKYQYRKKFKGKESLLLADMEQMLSSAADSWMHSVAQMLENLSSISASNNSTPNKPTSIPADRVEKLNEQLLALLREELQLFYLKTNPENVAKIEDNLSKYAGNEKTMIDRLEEKYGETLPERAHVFSGLLRKETGNVNPYKWTLELDRLFANGIDEFYQMHSTGNSESNEDSDSDAGDDVYFDFKQPCCCCRCTMTLYQENCDAVNISIVFGRSSSPLLIYPNSLSICCNTYRSFAIQSGP